MSINLYLYELLRLRKDRKISQLLDYQKTLELLQFNTGSEHFQFAKDCCNHDFVDLAYVHYQVALEKHVEPSELKACYLGLGISMSNLLFYKDSIAVFEQGISQFPNSFDLHLFRSISYFEKGNRNKAFLSLLASLLEHSSTEILLKEYPEVLLNYISAKKTELNIDLNG